MIDKEKLELAKIDDGAAFRLAVAYLEADEIADIFNDIGSLAAGTERNFDRCAATRRAIVHRVMAANGAIGT